MKRTLFVMTHLGSGYEKLVEVLNRHPLLEIFNTGESYAHHDDVQELCEQPHKIGGSAAIWGDVILYNKDFAMKRVCQHYNLIFWSNDSEECVDELISKHGYGTQQAWSYLGYRMDGMTQYWHRKYKTGVASLWNPDLEDKLLFTSIFG